MVFGEAELATADGEATPPLAETVTAEDGVNGAAARLNAVCKPRAKDDVLALLVAMLELLDFEPPLPLGVL